MFSRHPLFFIVLLFVTGVTFLGCASTGASSGDPADVVGNWGYEVTGLDVLDLRSGTIVISRDNEQYQGRFDAPHLKILPLQNIRYRAGELTFLVRTIPGQPQGVAFSLDPTGERMSGIAYPASSGGTIEGRARPGASTKTVDVSMKRR